jgi:hemolysin activation/secretion protein
VEDLLLRPVWCRVFNPLLLLCVWLLCWLLLPGLLLLFGQSNGLVPHLRQQQQQQQQQKQQQQQQQRQQQSAIAAAGANSSVMLPCHMKHQGPAASEQ